MTPLAVATPGFAGYVGLFPGNRLDDERRFDGQKIEFAGARVPVTGLDDDTGFDERRSGDQPIRIGLQCRRNPRSFRLHAEERDECRSIDDHDRSASGAGRARRTR